MKEVSELLDMQTRGEDITPNANNKVTIQRNKVKQGILSEADGNSSMAYAIAMSLVGDNITRLQEYVLSHSEEPAYDPVQLVNQVYELRMREAQEAQTYFDYDNDESLVHLDQQEAEFFDENGYIMDNFLGELWSPIEIAYTYNNSKKNFDSVDPALLQAGANIIGTKLSKSELKRAAQGKPAGIIGTLAPGGTSHYNALRSFFLKNPAIAQQVISGQISDESQITNWSTPLGNYYNNGSGINNLTDSLVGSQLKRAIPYIIGFLVLIFVIVYFASRNKK